MKVVYSPENLQHNPTFEVYDGVQETYPEVGERVEVIRRDLAAAGYEIIPPRDFNGSLISAVHTQRYINYLRNQSESITDGQRFGSNYIMDSYTPITHGTYPAARIAANVALTAVQEVTEGNQAYGLCRPPGHHAESQRMGGYCYFNNAAIAADKLAEKSPVAILDIDYHHGNGTQEIFYDRKDVLYVSLHADPDQKFPYISGWPEETGRGEGIGYNLNLPLPLDTKLDDYLDTLSKGIERVSQFDPKYLVVSLGFDTYKKDPIAGFDLDIEDYAEIGKEIRSLEVPTVLIQEGGYYVPDLGKAALSFLSGFSG
jgi:acetoin utilization deacetylase AcuC-like enzyme